MEKLTQPSTFVPQRSRSLHDQSGNELPKKEKISTASLNYESDRRRVPKTSKSNEFVYVNHAYVGSVSGLNETRITVEPSTTSVYREQYWACAKWPAGQRFLALAVGLLLGTVIGLAVTVAMKNGDTSDILPDFFRSRPD